MTWSKTIDEAEFRIRRSKDREKKKKKKKKKKPRDGFFCCACKVRELVGSML